MSSSSRILLLLVCCLSVASAPALKSDVSGHQVVNGRRSLQVEKPCPINFETKNYSKLTSECKAPEYLPKGCCNALKDIACPVLDYINDLTTDCVKVMFSYINRIGHYPPGLFSDLCREGKEGLACPDAAAPLSPPPQGNGWSRSRTPVLIFQLLMLLSFRLM